MGLILQCRDSPQQAYSSRAGLGRGELCAWWDGERSCRKGGMLFLLDELLFLNRAFFFF